MKFNKKKSFFPTQMTFKKKTYTRPKKWLLQVSCSNFGGRKRIVIKSIWTESNKRGKINKKHSRISWEKFKAKKNIKYYFYSSVFYYFVIRLRIDFSLFIILTLFVLTNFRYFFVLMAFARFKTLHFITKTFMMEILLMRSSPLVHPSNTRF